jgi:hypothetical protein
LVEPQVLGLKTQVEKAGAWSKTGAWCLVGKTQVKLQVEKASA